jgi:hypothetical protein
MDIGDRTTEYTDEHHDNASIEVVGRCDTYDKVAVEFGF